ncbi:LPXTG cell wall anchor domain-containing protein [Glycomyces sp. A-F 0318]|uniref:LPXTG cell wall anchor domain-containing protein n=1 Tax=Glycomyces amatae TaxID=2881355 RepID=UPI001E56A8C7|nr:LPXTG cell wall anchor domain-containing protein [Glycomyces amatae]MCD0444408.1 LPXTG cell wall anchor domain-containing protein [Glycomyces amatae]
MSPHRNRPGRAPLRLALITAAALGAGSFASPAFAQVPTPEEVRFEDGSPVTADGGPALFTAEVVFGEDLPAGHTVAMTVLFDLPAGAFAIEDDDGDGDCTTDGPYDAVCSLEATGDRVVFDFRYTVTAEAAPGFAYFADITVDGATVDRTEGAIEVLPAEEGPGEAWPYLHGDAVFTGVEPGAAVGVRPEFRQEHALPEDAAAVVVTFSEPEHPFDEGRGADAAAGYDNCVDRYWDHPGVTCVVTDFADAPGAVFTPTVPVDYVVSEAAPGPVDVCVCYYSAYIVDADLLEERFGDVDWDPGSGNLFGLRTVAEPESEFADSTVGEIVIETTDHPWDLTAADVAVKGGEGDRVRVAGAIANEGPASAYAFFDGPGSYAVVGAMPEGAELRALPEDAGGLFCLDREDWPHHLPEDVDTGGLDFACFFQELAAGESFAFAFTVEVTDPDAAGAGWMEVLALDDDGYPGVLDADLGNNTAAITLDGAGSGRLPSTGSSLTLALGVAAAALAAGVLLFVLGRRRRPGGE